MWIGHMLRPAFSSHLPYSNHCFGLIDHRLSGQSRERIPNSRFCMSFTFSRVGYVRSTVGTFASQATSMARVDEETGSTITFWELT